MATKTKVKSSKEKDLKKSKSKDKVKSKKVEKTTRAPKAKKVITPITEKFTRGTLVEALSTLSGVEMKLTKKVYTALENVILGSLIKKGRGEFIMPTLLKIVTKVKPATKERKGTNPFTGEPCVFKAKPKTTVVKARPLGKIKKAAKGEL